MRKRNLAWGGALALLLAILALLLALSRRAPVEERPAPRQAPDAVVARPAPSADVPVLNPPPPPPPETPSPLPEPPPPSPAPASVVVVHDLGFPILIRLGEDEREAAQPGEIVFEDLAPGTSVLVVLAPPRLVLARLDLVLSEGGHRRVVLSSITHGVEARGRTIDRAGRPVPRALVKACVEGMPDRNEIGEVHVRSDREGRFRVLLAAGLEYRFYGEKEGFGPLDPPVARADPDDPPEVDVVLSDDVLLPGRVIDASGHPVPGARVRAGRVLEHAGSWKDRTHEQHTDEMGRFLFDDLPEGWLVRIDVRKEGFARRVVPHYRMMRGGAEVVIVLRPEHVLEVLVLDETSGEPLENATFSAGRTGPGAVDTPVVRGEPGREGIYRLRSFSAEDRIRIGVGAPGHFGRQVVAVVGEPGPLVVRLRQTGDVTMKGRVVNRRGRPVSGVRISCFWMDRSARGPDGRYRNHSLQRTSDTRGRFTLTHLRGGARYQVSAKTDAPSRQMAVTPPRYLVAEPGGEVVLVVLPVGRFRARVERPQADEPLGQALVRFDRCEDGEEGWPYCPGIDHPERMGIDDIPVGSYDVTVRVRPWLPVVIRGVEIRAGKTTDVGTIRLAAGGRLEVTVRNGSGHPPEERTWVAAVQPGVRFSWSLVRDHGVARFSNLHSGRYFLLACPAGWRPVHYLGEVEIRTAECRAVAGRIGPPVTIRILVRNARGGPSAGVPVSVRARAPAPIDRVLANGCRTPGWWSGRPDLPERLWEERDFRTDARGRVEVGPVAAGQYVVEADDRSVEIEAAAGEIVDAVLDGHR